MEALEPGRPLSFLDHRIVLGNSLLGTTPELIAAGIPAEAFKPILGDDKNVVAELRKRNAKELAGQLASTSPRRTADADARAIAAASAAIAAVDDTLLSGVREQQHRFESCSARRSCGARAWLPTSGARRSSPTKRLGCARSPRTHSCALGAAASRCPTRAGCRRSARRQLYCLPALARSVPGRLGAGRLRRRARQPALGARQAPGEGVLRHSVSRDREAPKQGRPGHD